MTGLMTVSYFLLSLFFNLLIFILWTRIALRYFRISSLHPVSQIIYKFSLPLTLPLERLFQKKPIRSRYDWVSFSLLIFIELLQFIVIGLFFFHTILPVGYLLLYTAADLIIKPCNFLFYAIIARVILSWINPRLQHPIAEVLYIITEPFLRFGRRILPDISGFDFSPIIVLILLKVVTLFIRASLPYPLI